MPCENAGGTSLLKKAPAPNLDTTFQYTGGLKLGHGCEGT